MNKSSLLRTALAGAYAFAASGISLTQAQSVPHGAEEDVTVVAPPPNGPKTLNYFGVFCPDNNPEPIFPKITAIIGYETPQEFEKILKHTIPEVVETTQEGQGRRVWKQFSTGMIEKDGTLRPARNAMELQSLFEDVVQNPEKQEGAPADDNLLRQRVIKHARDVCSFKSS